MFVIWVTTLLTTRIYIVQSFD